MVNSILITTLETYNKQFIKSVQDYKTAYQAYMTATNTNFNKLSTSTSAAWTPVSTEIDKFYKDNSNNNVCKTTLDAKNNVSANCVNTLLSNYGCTTHFTSTGSGMFQIDTMKDAVFNVDGLDLKNVISYMGAYIGAYPTRCAPIINTVNTANKIISDSSGVSMDISNNINLQDTKQQLDIMYDVIKKSGSDINNLIQQLSPLQAAQQNLIKTNIPILLKEIDDMQIELVTFDKNKNQPTELDGNYEVTSIQTTSNFYKYILYFFVTFFIIGCLVVIYWFPTLASEKIDYFILALAGIIIIYYLWDYFANKIMSP
jgi:hypothetical protein